MTHALVVHGYDAVPDANWFPWLTRELERHGIPTEVVELPTPERPDLQEWLDTLAARVGTPGHDTHLVAHSLGCVSLLRHLLTLPAEWSAASLTLVSGFLQPLPTLPLLDTFTATELTRDDLAPVVRAIPRRTVIRSDDDPTVPPAMSAQLAAVLEADSVTVPHGGHFVGDDGWVALPAALAAVLGASPAGSATA